MRQFTVVPIPKEYVERLKTNNQDEFGNPIIEQISSGYGPCRVSLKPLQIGIDRRLIFMYSPFKYRVNPIGPVIVCKSELVPYNDIHRFPPELKADRTKFPLYFIGYTEREKVVYIKLVGEQDIEDLIEQIFHELPYVSFLHVRNANTKCFICKIERRIS